MKMWFKMVIGIAVLPCLAAALFFVCQPSFSERKALMMIYGNYDPINKSSLWVNIPFPDKEDISSYFEKRKGFVQAIFFKSYRENKKNKIFLLTKTIPTNIPFDCHACLPLIGAAVFVKKRNHWQIEAQNQFIMYDGEYGEFPVMKLIEIGKDRFGLSLEFEHGVVRDRELSILVPYKNSIVNAYKEVIYYENFNDCEYAKTIPCEAYTADIAFDKSEKGDFYGLQVKKFGTIYSDQKRKTMPVDQRILYQFINGAYSTVSWVGENYILKNK
ncbi:MAG TPA: hypothetical protein VLI69_06430 [Gammaproteobacteria bacterium]|nr:hypothetical protein [Gammaproteobacteria bacterium]